MRFGDAVVERQGFQGCAPNFGETFSGWHQLIPSKCQIDVGKTDESCRIVFIQRGRLLKVTECGVEVSWRAYIEIKEAHEICLVRRRVNGARLCEVSDLLFAQFKAELICDVAGGGRLQCITSSELRS